MKVKIKYLFIFVLLGTTISCVNKGLNEKNVQLTTFLTNDNWGYEIHINKKCYIHQEYIPSVSGKKCFESKKDAEAVGKLVIQKILNKKTPTVETGELRQLGIKGTS